MKCATNEEIEAAEKIILQKIQESRTYNLLPYDKKKEVGKIWKEEELDIRNRWIICQLVKRGMSPSEVRAYMKQKWEVSHTVAEKYVRDAIDSLVKIDGYNKNLAIQIHKERLEDLYAKAVDKNKIDSALKVLEQMAKINGYYNDTMIVNMPVMQFKFGDEDNIIHMNNNGGENIGGV